MPRFERPEPSTTADFGETETAATWAQDDAIEDMPLEDREYEGIYPPAPKQPNFRGEVVEGTNSRHLPLLGAAAVELGGRKDPYYEDKVQQGLLPPTEKR